MKIKKSITVGLCLLGMTSFSAFGNPGTHAESQDQKLNQLMQQTQALEKEVAALQSELQTVRSQEHAHPVQIVHVVRQTPVVQCIKHLEVHKVISPTVSTTSSGQTAHVISNGQLQPVTLQNPGNLLMAHQRPVAAQRPTLVPVQLISDHPIYIGGTPVVTSPYFGIRSKFDASDLIATLPTSNEDLRLLIQHKKLQKAYCKLGLPYPNHPVVEVSGQIQATTFSQRPFQGRRRSDIDLTDTELDLAIMFDHWVTGLMTFDYDNLPPAIGPRFNNSRVFIDRAFFTIGNLIYSPFYLTAGQFYVPFGKYSSSMISTPLTQIVGRIKARAVQLGLDVSDACGGVNATAFAYKGDTTTSRRGGVTVNAGGANLDLSVVQKDWHAGLGASVISNIADSQGFQLTGGLNFGGFGSPVFDATILPQSQMEVLIHRVPAYDLHGNLAINDWSLIAEYVRPTTSFSPLNLTYDGYGARPSALNVELAYNFKILRYPTIIAAGYASTSDALALLLPARRYLAVLNTSLWRDTILGLEFRHDINYNCGDTATGQGFVVFTPGLDRTSDQLSLQFTAYF